MRVIWEMKRKPNCWNQHHLRQFKWCLLGKALIYNCGCDYYRFPPLHVHIYNSTRHISVKGLCFNGLANWACPLSTDSDLFWTTGEDALWCLTAFDWITHLTWAALWLKVVCVRSQSKYQNKKTRHRRVFVCLHVFYRNHQRMIIREVKITMVRDVSTWKLIIKLSCDFILISPAPPLILCCRPLH